MAAVSVIIPVFNRAATIRRAVESALRQDISSANGSMEVILVDDGSTDSLSEALAGFDGRVRLIRHDRNMGAAAARNTGVAAASGDWLAFLDSDDVWLAGKIETQLSTMRSNGWKASCTSYYLARPRSQDIVSPRYGTCMLELSDLVWGCFCSPGSTLVCERSVFEVVGSFDTALLRLEDWDWLLRYAHLHGLGFVGKPLTRVVVTPNSHGDRVLSALARLDEKYEPVLAQADRKRFRAAIEIERAAVYFRTGKRLAALRSIFHSLWLEPFKNDALSAVMHNRLSRLPLV
jgi:glycosyltransferase involved in cell wall biosynthesis